MRFLLSFLLLSAVAVPAIAGSTDSSSRLLSTLGTPARPDVVAELVAGAKEDTPEQCVALADALGHAGGAAALDGLVTLLDHREGDVRRTALEAISRVRLRSEAAVIRIRRIVHERDAGELVPAIEALGYVGDGRDMGTLLELSSAEDSRTRRAAFRAMAELTGASVPYVRVRWAYYWKSFRLRATLLLPQTLVALGMEAGAPDSPALVQLVGRYGWVDLPTVRDHLSHWFVEPDTDLRIAACVLARTLLIADLAPEIESTLQFSGAMRLREEARRTLDALGVPQPEPEPDRESPTSQAE